MERFGLSKWKVAFVAANVKFPEGTAAGLYKGAVATQPNYDIMRVDSQRINWTLKELDVSQSPTR